MRGELYDDLARRIREKRVIAVVGAGVAIAATGRNAIAGWIGLLRHGVQRIEGLGRAPTPRWVARQIQILDEAKASRGDMDDLLGVAEQISARLGAPDNGEWVRWLEETVGSMKPVADRALLEAIAGLGIPIATTNYDGLLEQVTGYPPVTWEQTGAVVKLLRGEQQGVLHLHGFWREPRSVVLGIRDYQRVLGAGTAQHVQRVLPTLHGLLYIGCGAGLADPNFAALRAWIRESLAETTHRHIRLARDGEVDVLKKEHDLSERTFVLGFGPDFDDLMPFLKKLGIEVTPPSKPATATRAVGPRLWLVERKPQPPARELYATCEIEVPSQDHQPGDPLRVQFTGYFPSVTDDVLRLKEVRVGVSFPTGRRAEKRLGDSDTHECANGIEIRCVGRVGQRLTWTVRAPEPGGVLHGRSAKPANDTPLFELPGAVVGDLLTVQTVAFPKDFVPGDAAAAAECEGEAISVAKKRIMDCLRLRKIGRPDLQGEIVLDVTENIVEEAP